MECNKDEALRAKEIAEKKMENNDFEGARKVALKAQNLYPELENITQLLSTCDVHCSAQKGRLGSDKDWYGILQVEKFADELMVKRQYRRLALALHPDKNRFPGAEGAFKLICEANAVLSDPAKKSLYDSKIKVSLRSTSVNPPCHQINRTSQLNKHYNAQSNVSNGFSNINQRPPTQSTQSTFFVRQDIFWTSCPFCSVRYQYHREFVNQSLRCQTCTKVFVGYEITAQGVPLGSKSGQPAQYVPAKPDSSRPAGFQEEVVPNQGKFKMGIQSNKEASPSQAGSQGIASKKAVQPEPGVSTGSRPEGAAKISGDSKTKETRIRNANSFHGGKEGGTSNGDTINRETRDLKNRSRKRSRRVVESSESCDTLSDSDLEDVTMDGNFDDLATDLKSASSHVHFPRRSSRKRQSVSYKENEEDDIASSVKGAQATNENAKKRKDNVGTEDLKHGNHNGFPTDAEYTKSETEERGTIHSEETGGKSGIGADAVKIESGSERLSTFSDNPDIELCHCPDPEFSDFDKERDENRFDNNQFWACYDELDGMPRFYAKVKKVRTFPFELSITWLEAVPTNEDHGKWIDKALPVGCGSFKLGKTDKTSARLSFSHQVHCEKGKKRGSLLIYPREGEVWALFKNWDWSWSSSPENHKEFKYEIVEVLSDYVAGTGIKVGYLDKVSGFVSLFKRASQSKADSFIIGPNELYRFSHRVPCFKMTGSEREGVPVGSFELDAASLPLSPDDLYYPSKAKVERRNMDPGVHFSPLKSAERKGKSVVFPGTSLPKNFVDLEEVKGEVN